MHQRRCDLPLRFSPYPSTSSRLFLPLRRRYLQSSSYYLNFRASTAGTSLFSDNSISINRPALRSFHLRLITPCRLPCGLSFFIRETGVSRMSRRTSPYPPVAILLNARGRENGADAARAEISKLNQKWFYGVTGIKILRAGRRGDEALDTLLGRLNFFLVSLIPKSFGPLPGEGTRREERQVFSINRDSIKIPGIDRNIASETRRHKLEYISLSLFLLHPLLISFFFYFFYSRRCWCFFSLNQARLVHEVLYKFDFTIGRN